MDALALSVAAVLLGIAGVVLARFLNKKFVVEPRERKKAFFQGVAQALDPSRKEECVATPENLSGSYKNCDYWCQTYQGSRSKRPYFSIQLFADFPEFLEIRREKLFDKIGKSIGLASEVQTGDPEFDQKLYVHAESPDFAKEYLSSIPRRKAIQEIFSNGPEKIAFFQHALEVHFPFANPESRLKPEQVSKILELLCQLAGNLSLSVPAQALREIRKKPEDFMVWFASLWILLLGGAGLFVAAMNYFEPLGNTIYLEAFKYGLSLSILATLPLLLLFFQKIRGRSDAHLVFMRFLFLSLTGLWILGFSYFCFSNGYLDNAPPQSHVAPVIQKRISRGKTTSYYVSVRSWRKDGENYTLSVSRSFYETAQEGEDIILVTKPGYRNFEWVVEMRPARNKAGQ